jgi:hypothetical protein
VLALVAAAATPPLLMAAAGAWESEAANRVVAALTETTTQRRAGLTISLGAVFDSAALDEADTTLRDRLAGIEELSEATTSYYTFRGRFSVEGAESPTGVPVRLLDRPGAIEALTVVAGPVEEGTVWISSWLAETSGAEPGSSIRFEGDAAPETPGADVVPGGGATVDLVVAGIYQPLWSTDGGSPAGYWAGVPADLLPAFVGPFNEPGFELLVVEPGALDGSRLPGEVRWEVPLDSIPATLAGIRNLVTEYRSLESDAILEPALSGVFARLAGPAPPAPAFDSEAPGLLAKTEETVLALRAPLRVTRVTGVLLGTGVMVSAGAFLVRRRRREYRLLAGEGERWLRIGTRAFAQLTPIGVAGALVGTMAGLGAAIVLGPARSMAFESLDRRLIVAGTVAGLVGQALIVGLLGQAMPAGEGSEKRSGSLSPLVPVLAVALGGLFWQQVAAGSALRSDAMDVAVVGLPITALIASATLLLTAGNAVSGRIGTWWRRLSPAVYLPFRRLLRPDRTATLVAMALSIGLGLVVFSLTLVTSLQRTTDAAVATEVGGATNIDLIGSIPPAESLPALSTVARYQDTRVEPGQLPVRIVAVDTDTMAGALAWPEEFGLDLETAIGLLDSDLEGVLPVIALDGQSLPTEGGFGTSLRFPYQVVGVASSFTLASDARPSLLVSASRLDRFELERIAAAIGADPDSPEAEAGFRPPSSTFRKRLISRSTLAELAPFLTANELTARTIETAAERRTQVDLLGPLFAFDYLRLLGLVAAAASTVALLLHQTARARERALATVLMRRMGVPAAAVTRMALTEVALLVAGISVAAVFTARLTAGRVLGRFDPAPRLPPPGVVVMPWGLVVGALAVVGAWLVAATWLSQRSHRSEGEVLRDAE